ncbi:Hypothetical protein LCAKO_0241 [Lacticaseibacillus paracasei subsp. paracasei]|uniref:Uncharacterized protein n=1 Tax=Lacticaseibacillus paracasei subsp. paracasei TaxID=47714 RepID=A0AAP9HFH5_LACPA|nr:Hypothetical protein LOCK919_0254 [Lacticaseibacillus paracasei]QGV16824.1 Hypothetical protein LCAKO_0241 [Lacticaseibacillus paracasei subsp. paracasei]
MPLYVNRLQKSSNLTVNYFHTAIIHAILNSKSGVSLGAINHQP